MIAAMGKQLKQSVNVFHSFTLYRRLPKGIGRVDKFRRRRRCCPTFIVETVDSIDRSTFVISAKQEEILRVFDLERRTSTSSL